MTHKDKRITISIILAVFLSIGLSSSAVQSQSCSALSQYCGCTNNLSTPPLYGIKFVPRIADWGFRKQWELLGRKSWRTYNQNLIPNLARLSIVNGTLVGDYFNQQRCEIIAPGKYSFVHKYQSGAFPNDPSLTTTEILFANPIPSEGDAYIRHSQIAGGKKVLCAGELIVEDNLFANDFSGLGLNTLGEANTFSGHYAPPCRCLSVTDRKLRYMGLNSRNTNYRFFSESDPCI